MKNTRRDFVKTSLIGLAGLLGINSFLPKEAKAEDVNNRTFCDTTYRKASPFETYKGRAWELNKMEEIDGITIFYYSLYYTKEQAKNIGYWFPVEDIKNQKELYVPMFYIDKNGKCLSMREEKNGAVKPEEWMLKGNYSSLIGSIKKTNRIRKGDTICIYTLRREDDKEAIGLFADTGQYQKKV